MKLTEREGNVVEHLTLLATAFTQAAHAHSTRGDDEMHSTLAIVNGAKAAGLVVAIACIRGITPAEVDSEIEQDLELTGCPLDV